MKTALVAGLAIVALLGVGVVAASAAMIPGGMGGSAGGMGGGMMGGGMTGGGMGGMMGGDMQGMHDQMQGMDHDGCHCCQGQDDVPNT